MSEEEAIRRVFFIYLREAGDIDAEILIRRFGFNETLTIIAQSKNVSHQAISSRLRLACQRIARQKYQYRGRDELLEKTNIVQDNLIFLGRLWLYERMGSKNLTRSLLRNYHRPR